MDSSRKVGLVVDVWIVKESCIEEYITSALESIVAKDGVQLKQDELYVEGYCGLRTVLRSQCCRKAIVHRQSW